MITAIACVVGLGLVGTLLWFIRKGGADAAKAKVADEALKDVLKVAAPASRAELDGVLRQYKRD